MKISDYFDLGYPQDPTDELPERWAEEEAAEAEPEGAGASRAGVDDAAPPAPTGASPPPAPEAAPPPPAPDAAAPSSRRVLLVTAIIVGTGIVALLAVWTFLATWGLTSPAPPGEEIQRVMPPGAAAPGTGGAAEVAAGGVALVLMLGAVLLGSGALRRWVPKRLGLELGSWVLLALGIFVRQNIAIPELAWSPANLSLAGLLVSLVVAAAVFPWAMRAANRLRTGPGLEMLLVPFSLGFFLDLAAVAAVAWIPQLI